MTVDLIGVLCQGLHSWSRDGGGAYVISMQVDGFLSWDRSGPDIVNLSAGKRTGLQLIASLIGRLLSNELMGSYMQFTFPTGFGNKLISASQPSL